MTTLSSPTTTIEFGPGKPVLLINDQLRIMDQNPLVFQDLRSGKTDRLVELAKAGMDKGINTVDILVCHPDLDETFLLPLIARRINEELGCFISLDSRNPQALSTALEAIAPSKAIINSVTAEQPLLDDLLPLARKFKAAIAGLPIGKTTGVPETVSERLSETRVILNAAREAGIPQEDVIIDAICLASAASPDSFQTTYDTLQALRREFNVSTILGIGNAGYGMPDPTIVDLSYLLAVIPAGLDSALVNPDTHLLVESVQALDFLLGVDPGGKRYIKAYRAKKKQSATPSQS